MRRFVTYVLAIAVVLGLVILAMSCTTTVYVTPTPPPTPKPTPSPMPTPTPTLTLTVAQKVAIFFSETEGIGSELVDINNELAQYEQLSDISSYRRDYLASSP
jgi:hypothetical protein